MAWRLFERPNVGRPRGPTVHGTLNAYRKHGCRCDLCRAANAAFERAYRARRAARDK